MSSLAIALIILACMASGILLGVILHYVLPEHHTQHDSKEIMKLAAGMMATLVALIIGLMVSSAKSAFDTTNASITQGGRQNHHPRPHLVSLRTRSQGRAGLPTARGCSGDRAHLAKR